jgi:hypothetical protein
VHRILLIVLVAWLLPALVTAQDVLRVNGGNSDSAGALTTDLLGNFYVAGRMDRVEGGSRFSVIKHNPSGGVDWVAHYSGAAGGQGGAATSVAVDQLGNVFAAGYTWFNGNNMGALDYLVVKFNASGVEQWARRYNGDGDNFDSASHVAIDAAGDVYVTGRSYGATSDWATLKYSPAGVQQWLRRFTSPAGLSEDFPVDLLLDPSGNVVVVGQTSSFSGVPGHDVATVKYSPAGAQLWQAVFSETANSDDVPSDASIDGAGNIFITGTETASSSPEQEVFGLVLRYNSDGQLQFAVTNSRAGGNAVTTNGGGELLVAGVPAPDFATPLPGVAKFSASGSLIWHRVITTPGFTVFVPRSILADESDNVFVTGTLNDLGAGSRDYLTLKLDTSGTIVWQHRFNGLGNGHDDAIAMARDLANNLLVAGTSDSGSQNGREDIVTLKFANGSAPAPQPPAAPSGLAAMTITGSSVGLQWQDNSSNETGFRIERCSGAGCTNFAQVAQVGAGTTSFSSTGLSKNTRYSFRVRAFNATGTSGASNVVSVTTAKK